MEAFKTKAENSFKNNLIILLTAGLIGVSVYSFWKVNEVHEKYRSSAYFISPDMTYLGSMQHDYHMGAVEIRAHARLFYSTMFTFSADSYRQNIDFAKDNLLDLETGLYIESRFADADVYNKLLRANGQLITVIDSISKPDLRQEPIKVRAYCRQFLVSGEEKSEQSFVNEYDLYYTGIARTDNNPFGLQIRNWRNISTN